MPIQNFKSVWKAKRLNFDYPIGVHAMNEKEYDATVIEYEWPAGCKNDCGDDRGVTISASALIDLIRSEGESLDFCGGIDEIEYDEENRRLRYIEGPVGVNPEYYSGPYPGFFDNSFSREFVVSLDDCLEVCTEDEGLLSIVNDLIV